VQIKLIDAFVLYLSSLIVWQVFYRYVLGTDFPKNAYLSGILAPLGVIVTTIALRLQITSQANKVSVYRAFWEFLAALLVLFVVIVNFLG
jgi:oligosaccharyltransferase complex subunit epsilon